MDAVRKIATTVLYEGYILWPYTRSATKNQQRWTFGGIYPRSFSDASGGTDPWFTQTQVIVTGAAPAVEVTVRFLQVVRRQVLERRPDGAFVEVDQLQVSQDRYLSWEEAMEREITLPRAQLRSLTSRMTIPVEIPAGSNEELLMGSDGTVAGKLLRSWAALEGEISTVAETVADGVHRLTVRFTNTAAETSSNRDEVLRVTFASTHAVLRVGDGEFVSMTDPPEKLASFVSDCKNIKVWPVLVGESDRRLMLSSPIILSDYPAVAPESEGDLYDGGEIDQLLLLNVLSMSDGEKEEMRATDLRGRAILERAESMTVDDFMKLHGTIRDLHVIRDDPFIEDGLVPVLDLERPAPDHVLVQGTVITSGSRVRLHPKKGGDIFDLALDGKIAIVEGINQDYEDRIHLAVTVEDDPGRQLGNDHVLGHRFFFSPEEVEPVDEGTS